MSGSNVCESHFTAEECWNQLSGAVRRAGQCVQQGNTQTSGKPRGHSWGSQKRCFNAAKTWFILLWILWLQ